ncbi:MAG TPA: hypothetical protein VGQ89_16755 [Candidatus Limnocylindrales bacterium]|nr:hypothetical protein [Candidatus Limnocylindrales bacterium]
MAESESAPDGEAPAEVVRHAFVEATGCCGSTEADRGGPPGKGPTDEGGTVGKIG